MAEARSGVASQRVIEGLRVKLVEVKAASRACEQRPRALAKDQETIARARAIPGSDPSMPRLNDRLDGELRGRTTYWRIRAEA
jgi:hypothetical protein